MATRRRQSAIARRLTRWAREAAINSGGTSRAFTVLSAYRPLALNVPEDALPAGRKALRIRRVATRCRRAAVVRRLTRRTRKTAKSARWIERWTALLRPFGPLARPRTDKALTPCCSALRIVVHGRAGAADDQQQDEDSETLDWLLHAPPPAIELKPYSSSGRNGPVAVGRHGFLVSRPSRCASEASARSSVGPV